MVISYIQKVLQLVANDCGKIFDFLYFKQCLKFIFGKLQYIKWGSEKMYIESLHYKNIGPLSDLNIQFRKNEKGVPIPLVVVGKNGSG